VISAHYNCRCVHALITLKMAALVAATCRWLLCYKTIFHTTKAICWYV